MVSEAISLNRSVPDFRAPELVWNYLFKCKSTCTQMFKEAIFAWTTAARFHNHHFPQWSLVNIDKNPSFCSESNADWADWGTL
jgi:hypothetical protein